MEKQETPLNVIPDETKSRSGIQRSIVFFWIPDIRLWRIPE